MLTSLLLAFVKDALLVVRTEGFFRVSRDERQKHIESVLGDRYPEALREYLGTISHEDFVEDVRGFLDKITGDRLVSSSPRLLEAVYQALVKEVAQCFDERSSWEEGTLQSAAAQVLSEVFATRQAVELGREIQRYLQIEHRTPSPTVQTALPLSSLECSDIRRVLRDKYAGSFPVFEVEASLGGGMRLFFNGVLQDRSWMADAARLFSRWSPAS